MSLSTLAVVTSLNLHSVRAGGGRVEQSDHRSTIRISILYRI